MTYFSVYDDQCGQYFHAGRDSTIKEECVMNCAEMLIEGSPAICECGIEYSENNITCEHCGWKTNNYYDTEYKLAEENPEVFLSGWEAHLVEHEEPIGDDYDE